MGKLDTVNESVYIKKFADKINQIIKNSDFDEIKAYQIPIIDDQGHVLVMKNNVPIFYMVTHRPFLPFESLFDTIDPVKDASYKFTVYSNPIVHFEGSYDELRDLVSLVPKKTTNISYEDINSIPLWQNPEIQIDIPLDDQFKQDVTYVLPDALQKEQQDLLTKGFKIEYVGKYPEQLNGLSNVDIYWAKDISEVRNGFPIVYAVHENVIVSKIADFGSFKILEKTRKSE